MTDKRRFPDPQELAIFLEVAKQRSFSQAALRLGVTTSSVSQSVTHLEKSLDATLVNRAHRPIELTCAGDRLYRKSGPILNELERTVRELKPAPGFYPEVRLGLSESVSGTLSPCLLQKIRTVSNRITVSTGFMNTLAKNFQNGEIDILISGRTFVNEADLWRGTIFTEEFLLLFPESWGRPVTEENTLDSLARDLPFITYNDQSDDKSLVRRLLRAKGVPIIAGPRVESSYSMVELVSEGKGWAVMAPTNIYRGGPFLSGVRFASLPSPGLKRTQKVLARTDEYIPLAGRIAGWCRELCLSTVKPRLKALSSKLDEAVFLPPHTP